MQVAAYVLATALAQVPAAGAPPAHPREARLYETGEGAFAVSRPDVAEPFRGAEIYRAVHRFDLLAVHEREVQHRRLLFVMAGVSFVGGPALGWVFGKAGQRSYDQCVESPPPPGCVATEEERAKNDRVVRRGILIGSLVGAATGVTFGYFGWRAVPHVPDREEARELVDRYNAGLAGSPADPPKAPAEPPATLRVVPMPGGVQVALDGRF